MRNLEVIGQVVRDLGPDALANTRPEVPWTRIAGARNVLAHQYPGVDLKLVWRIVEADVPTLEAAVRAIARAEGIDFGAAE